MNKCPGMGEEKNAVRLQADPADQTAFLCEDRNLIRVD